MKTGRDTKGLTGSLLIPLPTQREDKRNKGEAYDWEKEILL